MDIGIDVAERSGATVVAVSGDVDMQTAPQLAEALQAVSSSANTSLVVDLSAVEFLDSSGLGVLVAAHRELSANGGRMKLVRPRPAINKVLTLTRLTEIIEAFDSLDDALS